jgi:Fe-S cluster assembly ATPase SufC
MENIKIEVKENLMIITIDTTRELGPSRSGKTQIVATTSGNQKVTTPNGEIVVGINAYKAKKF